jgi:hypothetical protein
MNLEITIKLLGAATAIFALGKTIYYFITTHKTRQCEEYKFARDFLKDVASGNLHPFALEKGYRAIVGKNNIKGEEIAYILTLEDPVSCLSDFVKSRGCVELQDTAGNLHVTFSKKYQRPWSRTWRKIWYVFWYAVCGFCSMAPLLYHQQMGLESTQALTLTVITLPVGWFYAWQALEAFAHIHRGEALVKNQKQHTQRIVLDKPIKP